MVRNAVNQLDHGTAFALFCLFVTTWSLDIVRYVNFNDGYNNPSRFAFLFVIILHAFQGVVLLARGMSLQFYKLSSRPVVFAIFLAHVLTTTLIVAGFFVTKLATAGGDNILTAQFCFSIMLACLTLTTALIPNAHSASDLMQ